MGKTLSYYLHYINRHMKKELLAYDKEHNISSKDCMIVDFVFKRKEQGLDTIQKDIEDEFYIGKAVTSGLLTSLEKKGYIERKVDINDQRKKILLVTKQGQEFNEFNLEKIKRFDNQLTDKLKKKDRETLFKLLDELILKIKEEEHDEKY